MDKHVYGTDGRQRTRILETAGNLKISITGRRVLLSCTRTSFAKKHALAAGGAYVIETKAR